MEFSPPFCRRFKLKNAKDGTAIMVVVCGHCEIFIVGMVVVGVVAELILLCCTGDESICIGLCSSTPVGVKSMESGTRCTFRCGRIRYIMLMMMVMMRFWQWIIEAPRYDAAF